MTPKDDVTALFKARNTLLWVVTREELRVERLLLESAANAKYEVMYWDCATGLVDAEGKIVDGNARDPVGVLGRIRREESRRVYILRDLHAWLRDPMTIRTLKSVARELQSSPRTSARAIVVLTPTGEIPPELQGCTTVIDWPIPTRDEMAAVLDSVMSSVSDNVKKLENGGREAAIDAAMGLTADEAASCYAKSLVTKKAIDVVQVGNEKKRVIARERVLTWTDPDARGLNAIGGLDNLKTWLTTRRIAFGKEARDYGLPAPRGVLLVGVPGCGKSLTAKAVSAAWGVPLLRLDLGALKSKWVGESESNIRRALSVAETVAPCVLWLDELEKSLGGATSGAADGGVSADALGAVLLWMQERTAPVFVVATANQVEVLPPELLRKGRFDEMFFVDLPTRAERAAVIRATMAQFKRNPASVDAAEVADLTVGFSGAELAALIPDAMFVAFSDKKREITTEDVLTAAQSIVPMSQTSAEKISGLREWSKGRCRLASRPDTTTDSTGGRQLDI